MQRPLEPSPRTIETTVTECVGTVRTLGGSVEIFLTDWNAAHETTST